MRAILLNHVHYGIMEEFPEYYDVKTIDTFLASDGKKKSFLTNRTRTIEKTGMEVIEDVLLDV
ncbi:hypothetical protein [Trichococcus collinsii]|uniref:Uncharacterized protein n=1 Tax=Trichococcus collinsii TaxID=157076 RepID=A0AB37ZXM9_9LACT|nr:hypothetical protein [Trichococcus collinsii]CZR03295.1 Hypothetical protein Tcol_2136 [Trichococcus collinsii]SDZ99150.1 hypothetical protein SAMN04488525_101807 [Trichococcus collinsii]